MLQHVTLMLIGSSDSRSHLTKYIAWVDSVHRGLLNFSDRVSLNAAFHKQRGTSAALARAPRGGTPKLYGALSARSIRRQFR